MIVTAMSLVFATLLPVSVAAQAHDDFLSDAEVRRFIAEMVERHGFQHEELTKLLGESRLQQRVLDLYAQPAEAKPWYQYRPIFLTPTRISGGVAFWKEHRAVLAQAEKAFGVSAAIIVAIIGVESNYGQRKGTFRVVDALMTLVFRDPSKRRRAFFRRELEEFLLLTREETFQPVDLVGSYAGAMGVPQFIPSSYRAYAVDFDGDRVRDLLTSIPDAIGSVGNYLKRHGWLAGAAVAIPADAVGDEIDEIVKLGIKPKLPLAQLKNRGVIVTADLPEDSPGALIELESGSGPEYWVALQNFYTITRYNQSKLYAMAVYQLATAIHARYNVEN